EAHALVVEDPAAALLAVRRPLHRLVEQPPHRADPVGGDPESLLGEPLALQVVATADPPPRRADPVGGDPESLLGEPLALQVVATADPADHRLGAQRHLLEAEG